MSTWLIQRFHDPLLPVYLILTYGALGLALMVPMAETNGRSLDE